MLVFGDSRTNYGPEFPDVNYATALSRGMFKGAGIVPGKYPLNGAGGMGSISISNPLVLGIGALAAWYLWKHRHSFSM